MSARLWTLWESLRASFWFVPTLLVCFAAALALALVALDRSLGESALAGLGWVYGGGPEGARALLSAVAGSVITVAGTTFSITIAALSLASSQFGPRLLRNFVRDRGNQIVLGTFIATFLYCLLVLRTVRGLEERSFVPHLAVTGAVALTLASIGVLIYFIHHVATSIQADHVIARVADELSQVIDRLYPEMLGRGQPSSEPAAPPELLAQIQAEGAPVAAPRSGYLQALDADALMDAANAADGLVYVRACPGDWLSEGSILAYAWSADRLDPRVCERLRQAAIIGALRTDQQDVRFTLNQLVEIGVRALSPGINDPFTALACIDRLGAALKRLAARDWPTAERYNAAGQLRVIADAVSFPTLLETTLGPLRHYGGAQPLVLCHLLAALDEIAGVTTAPERRAALGCQVELIASRGAALADEADGARVTAAARRALRTIAEGCEAPMVE